MGFGLCYFFHLLPEGLWGGLPISFWRPSPYLNTHTHTSMCTYLRRPSWANLVFPSLPQTILANGHTNLKKHSGPLPDAFERFSAQVQDV